MTEKEKKKLLFRVFCDGYPHNLRVCFEGKDSRPEYKMPLADLNNVLINHHYPIEDCRPYLRSWNSATQKERRELNKLLPHDFEAYEGWDGFSIVGDEEIDLNTNLYRMSVEVKDYLDEHHFNYRLPIGMFIEAPRGMYKH